MSINAVTPATYSLNGKVRKQNYVNFEKKCATDSFEKSKVDKSKNGKFDISEAGKNFLKGVISPITAMIKHPLAAAGMLAGTLALCSLVPVLGPALAIGFGAYSVYQLGKGCVNVAKNCKNGNYDDAEKAFTTVGEGAIGTALSIMGVKQGAKVAKEAKLMSELNTTSLSTAQKAEIAKSVDNAGFIANLKENVTLFTSKTGLKAVGKQFKPDMLKARFTEIKNVLTPEKWKQEKEISRRQKSLEKRIEDFKKSPEGIRRASLTEEQIQSEVEALYNEAFDKLNIPKEQRPTLSVKKQSAAHGGSYNHGKHTLEFNPETYRSGVMEIEDVMMHEATHCKEALLRAGIPQDRVDAIIRDELVSRIMNGESEKILKSGSLFGPEMMDPPKMSPSMKKDFAQFAKENLYTKDSESMNSLSRFETMLTAKNKKYPFFDAGKYAEAERKVAPLVDKLKAIISKNPEFAKQYASEQEALGALVEYSLSHEVRYTVFTNTGINGGAVKVAPLSGDALAAAEKSLIDSIATTEGNARMSGLFAGAQGESGFNQYQFSPEEVLAQKNGNTNLIEKFTAKMQEMRESGTLTAEKEAYMTKAIEKAKVVIEYKTKGLAYYEKYTQMLQNPGDTKLAATVKAMADELKALAQKMDPDAWDVVTRTIIEMPDHAKIDLPAIINAVTQSANKAA